MTICPHCGAHLVTTQLDVDYGDGHIRQIPGTVECPDADCPSNTPQFWDAARADMLRTLEKPSILDMLKAKPRSPDAPS